ncbi:protein SPT2 homolog isoform X2 [Nematolebias whitei]|nr:protein SPT2 homolog isoform X2 [Nematolebias whitei]
MKKQKDELLAKRVELKSDRKARAMASRTKDNFKGYNGIPVLEIPKKRGSKLDKQLDESDSERFRNDLINPLDDEDNYEYEQTDSEPEQEPEMQRPGRTIAAKVTSSSSKSFSKKPCGQPRPASSTLNFADLLKLAEKKQFEPVELKPKVVKKEERLRTADEIRELEMERKAKGLDKNRDSKAEPPKNSKSQPNLVRKSTQQKEQKFSKPQTQKTSVEKPAFPSDQGKKPHLPLSNDRGLSSSKSSISDRERSRDRVYHSDRERPKASMSGTSGAIKSKIPSKVQSSQVSAKQGGPRPSSATQKVSTSSDLSFRRDNLSSHQKGASGISGNRPSSSSGPGQKPQQGSSHQTRPIQGSCSKQGPTVGGIKSGKGEPVRPGYNSTVKSNSSSGMRPSLGGPPKAGSQPQGRLGGTIQTKPGNAPQVRPSGSGPRGHPGSGGFQLPGAGTGRPGSGGLAPGRPTGSFGSGPGRPKCTVVSETISSKNVGGARPGVPPRPGMQQRPGVVPRPGMPPRPMMNRPPGPMLPPITSAYKRKYEDEEEEYDPEMDDFIDDGGEEQEEISRHIREIFGYDRSKYKEESDYALKFMESSWKDMQSEEARSLRMAVQEDLEEERREEEELKRQKAKRKKPN